MIYTTDQRIIASLVVAMVNVLLRRQLNRVFIQYLKSEKEKEKKEKDA